MILGVALNALDGPTWIDWSKDVRRQVVIDREPGQYLGHPTTTLLEDGKTILCVYPKGHGKGAIVFKRSPDGGTTWSERLPTPKSWESSLETPTIHNLGQGRLILWSGLFPARLSHTEDSGSTWSELQPIGDWGGIVVMSALDRMPDGRLVGMFHDDGRFFKDNGQASDFTLYQTESRDGRAWTAPKALYTSSDVDLCEPGFVWSPDHKELCALLRENTHRQFSHAMFSRDDARTWTTPRPLFPELTGDRHVAKYAKDGRLVVVFRDTMQGSPWWGDWVAWVGRYEDIIKNRPGQYRVRLMDNTKDGDCGYSGLEVLADGTFVATSYGHWTKNQQPYVACTRFKLSDLK